MVAVGTAIAAVVEIVLVVETPTEHMWFGNFRTDLYNQTAVVLVIATVGLTETDWDFADFDQKWIAMTEDCFSVETVVAELVIRMEVCQMGFVKLWEV